MVDKKGAGLKGYKRRIEILCYALILLLLTASGYDAAAAQERIFLEIPAKPAPEALKTLSYKTGRSILFQTNEVETVETNAISGKYTLLEALDLLLDNTTLSGGLTESGVITISLSASRHKTDQEGEMTSRAIKGSLLTTVATILFGAGAATAQDTGDASQNAGSDQIVVTATRREATIQDVPLSIEAFSQQKIDRQGLRSIDDVANFTPGVNFSRTASTASNISIRGISSGTGSATTGIYIDDTPVQARSVGSQPRNAYPNTFDIERVEVLRGPQGTLFGAGAEGGAVRFITRKPSLDDYSVYSRNELALTQGGDASYETGLAVGGPIVEDKLGFRISGYYRMDGGFIDRETYLSGITQEENANDLETYAARAALKFQPTENISISPSVYYNEIYSHENLRAWENLSDASNGDYVIGTFFGEENRDRYVLPALDIALDLGAVSIASSTSYFRRNEDGVYDYTIYDLGAFTSTPEQFDSFFSIPGFSPTNLSGNDQYNWNQEIRISNNDTDSRLNWIVGMYYGKARQTSYQSVQNEFFFYYFGDEVLYSDVYGDAPLYDENIEASDSQIAGFGEVSFEITDGLTATAGVRYAHTSFDFTGVVTSVFSGAVPVQNGGEQSENPITPKFALSYEWGENLVYASATKGYRIGGANRSIPFTEGCNTALNSLGIREAPNQYDSDSVWSYEVGTKNTLFDNSLRVAASVYYIDWSNIIRGVGGLQNCPYEFITNLGDATSKGVDLQLSWDLTDSFSVLASVGYNEAQFDTTIRSAGAVQDLVTEGHTLGGSPWTVALSGNYETMIAAMPAYLRADYNFRSSNKDPIPGRDPNYPTMYDPLQRPEPEFHDVRIRAGVSLNESVEISLFVNNLLDQHPKLNRSRVSTVSPVFEYTPVRPRTVGLTAVVNY